MILETHLDIAHIEWKKLVNNLKNTLKIRKFFNLVFIFFARTTLNFSQ